MKAFRKGRFRAGAWLRSGAIAGSLVAALFFAGTAFGWRDLSITTLGFVPGVVTEDGQQDLHWTNETPVPHTVSSNEGLFESGDIPPGGGFSMKLQVPGHHVYGSNAAHQTHTGAVDVSLEGLPGDPGDPAAGHIPDVAFPPAADADIQVDPRWGVGASTTRIMLGFDAATTVGQVNTLLTVVHARIIGGLPDAGILLVEVAPSFGADPFANLTAALATFRADPSVDFAAMSFAGAPDSVPRGSGDAAAQGDTTWPGDTTWTWTTTDKGGNWGLKIARFPQAWSFLESIRRKAPKTLTGVVDGGFDERHEDLRPPIFTLKDQLCPADGGMCHTMGNDREDHGTHVAGIIGAAYDNDLDPKQTGRSRGVSGGNPVARMIGYPGKDFDTRSTALGVTVSIADLQLNQFDLILRSLPAGMRVINHSFGMAIFGDANSLRKDDDGYVHWWKRYPFDTCGPGAHDDDPRLVGPGSKQTCTPNNEDDWLEEMDNLGRAAARVARKASQKNVMIVQSAGNDSWFFCRPPSDTNTCHEAIHAENRNEFAWASANWSKTLHFDEDGLTDPVLVVEAANQAGGLTQFSDDHGDIAAPGDGVLSTVNNDRYRANTGTSMAAPYVTALVGYLLADDPSLTLAELRHRVLDYTTTPPRPGSISAPWLDAFASMLAGPGAAKRLVDVNDVSTDGDRRVTRDRNADGTITESEYDTFSWAPNEETAPDGHVDMRDFRRFRDAYLQICATGDGDAQCPAPGDIKLDGGGAHPKKDLNFDHCVRVDPENLDNCDARERDFSRFDFNGDGAVGVVHKALVPLTADGGPAAKTALGTELSDLEVFQSQWSPDMQDYEGWRADDLPSLIRSADLEVHADALFGAGASSAQVWVRNTATGAPVGPTRTMKRGNGFAVVTVPLGNDRAQQYEVAATAKTLDGVMHSTSEPLQLAYGEDRRVDLCPGLGLSADPERIPADGTSRSRIALTLDACGGTRNVAGRPILWKLSPNTGGAALDLVPATTDADGKAVARFVAGTQQTKYTIEATVDLGNGKTETASVTIDVVPSLTVRYVWKQVYEDYHESGSTRWTAHDPLMPDCTIPGVVAYCIDDWSLDLDKVAGPYGATRTGTLAGGASAFKLTESVSNSLGVTHDSWTTSTPDGQKKTAQENNQWLVSDPQAYQDYSVNGLRADDAADGLHLGNLEAVGDLPYHYAAITSRVGGDLLAPRPLELGFARDTMLLVPHGDAGSIRFAAGPGQQLVFKRNPDGTLAPFQSCGRIDEDLTTQPGYYVASPSDWISGAMSVTRKTDYTGGDRPMPVGPGHLRVRYEFAAVASYAGQSTPVPQLPDCTQNHPPAADFTYTPDSPSEGHQVHFDDTSTDVENDISKWRWSFGDGATATGPSAYHIFADDGVYDVTLTVTDKDGASTSAAKHVVVDNLPPEADLDAGTVQFGQPMKVVSKLLDAGSIDKTDLQYTITSTNGAWPTLSGRRAANVYTDEVNGLPAGVYPLTLTVSDKDGGVATATAVGVVTEAPVQPPTESPLRFYPTCDPNTHLDTEETVFLDLVNDYRAENGLGPVAVSPTLNKAAEEHAHDMASNNFLSHTGTDGSQPWDRAWKAGYPRQAANSENIARGTPFGHDALWAWRGSTAGHNENMLNAAWVAIGIAREQGSGDWFWSTSYGDELDCPKPATSPAATPLALPVSAGEVQRTPTTVTRSSGGVRTVAVRHRLARRSWKRVPVRHVATAALPSRHLALARAAATSTTPATLLYPPTPAFTISNIEPMEKHAVTVTNRSRDSLGNPIAATIDFGDDTAPVELAAGESVDHVYAQADYLKIRATAADSAGRSAFVDRWTAIDEIPTPALSYTGPGSGFAGKQVTLGATAKAWTFGEGVPGLHVTFTVGGITADAVTDAEGVAHADVTLDGLEPGFNSVKVSSEGTPEWKPATVFGGIYVEANQPPTANAGGPYVLGLGNALLLDGSRSNDSDDSIASYAWDLDGDGAFDDATGATPLPVNWDQVSALVCGGTCAPDHDYSVALRVTDTRGDSATAAATVRFVSDFALTLGGETHTVVPGASNSFAVSVVASGGFTEPVTLSMQGLPAGLTADFSVNPVTPGHISVLTLTATNDAAIGTFPVVVSGTAAGITHTIGEEINVQFGLIPVCYGTVSGTVTDADTGEPLSGAVVNTWPLGTVFTDASGRFVFHDVPLRENNAPVNYWFNGSKDGWWSGGGEGLAVCGGTTIVRVPLQKLKKGHASGRVMVGVVDPTDHTRVAPTDTPIASASVSPYLDVNFPTDDDGKWSGDLNLAAGNTPQTYYMTAHALGYWDQTKPVNIDAQTPAEANFELVKQCKGTITGGWVKYSGPGGGPAPFHMVVLYIGSTRVAALTDAEGRFDFNRIELLGHNNAPVDFFVEPWTEPSDGPGAYGIPGSFHLQDCGAKAPEVVLGITRVPLATATVEGYVTDDKTNDPVAGATVAAAGATTTTDAAGYYKVKVNLGYVVGPVPATIAFAKTGYDDTNRFGYLAPDDFARWDVKMHLKRYTDRTVTGIVRDAATGAPIPSALVSDGCTSGSLVCLLSGADGRYSKTITLDDRTGPIGRTLTASAVGYWPRSKPVTLPSEGTTTVDFDLVKKCETARIVGTVVDANTQAPIQGAMVDGGNTSAFTNAAGRFELTDIQPGTTNGPLQVSVTASAGGYISQTKTVTVFCGATIVVDFGTRQTSLGIVVGTVTNADTGNPLPNVFVGTEFGKTATTDSSGNYRIEGVPLGDLNADRAWQVSALPAGFKPQSKTVVAKANVEVRADFGFSSVNQPPTASPQTLETNEDTALPVALAGADGDGDPLTYAVMRYPQHGTLTGTAPAVEYKPDHDWNGTDTFEFVANDGVASSERATVTIAVKPVNDAPVGTEDRLETTTGVPLRIPAATLLANDVDVDGDTLMLTGVTQLSDQPVHLEGDTIVFEPKPGYVNPAHNAYFSYAIDDGHGATGSANVLIAIDNAPAAPACPDRSFQVGAGKQLAATLSCTDANGDALTYSLVAGTAHGTVALNATGSFTYTAPAGYEGPDSFTYRAGDGSLFSPAATATITVVPANTAPACTDVSFQTSQDTPLADSVGCTDADADPLTYSLVAGPAHGTMALGAGGSFTYTPGGGYHGPDSFTFRASDGTAASNVAAASISIGAVNQVPAAADDAASVPEDGSKIVDVLANDSPGAGESSQHLTTSLLTPPAHGLALVTSGGISYIPAPDYSGSDTFGYLACDDGTPMRCAAASVAVTVTPVNDRPEAADGTVALDEDAAPVAVDLGALVSDVETPAAQLTYEVVDAPAKGTLTGIGPVLHYDANGDANGTDSFTYRVVDRGDPDGCLPTPACDAPLASEVHTVRIAIAPVNDTPGVTLDPAAQLQEGGSIDLAAHGSDPDGDVLTYTWHADGGSLAAHGDRATLSAADGPGSILVTVTVGDGSLTADTQTMVQVVDVAPTVEASDAAANEGAAVSVEASFADPGTDAETATIDWGDGTTTPANVSGTSVTGTHTYSDNGVYTVTVDVTDEDGMSGSDTATATIANVAPTVDAGPDAAVDEGSTVALAPATYADPGTADTHSATVDWGDGTSPSSLPATGGNVAASHAYDDNGVYTATVTVTDDDGDSSSDTLTVTVRNVAPSVNAGPDVTAPWGIQVAFVGTVTDPSGVDTAAGLHPNWSFGDSSAPVTDLATAHAYAQPGDYTATLAATDKDGGHASDDVAVHIVKRASSLGIDGSSIPYGTTTLTAHLGDAYDAGTGRLGDHDVVFDLAGTTYRARTDSTGVAKATTTAPLPPGKYAVTVRFDGDALYLPSTASATLVVATASTPGLVTGGALRSSANGRGGFNVHSDGQTVRGELQYQSPTAGNFHASAMTALGVASDGRSAWFAGVGDNGRPFLTYVEDNGEPGSRDVWRLWIDGRLETDGTLAGGNIAIHR